MTRDVIVANTQTCARYFELRRTPVVVDLEVGIWETLRGIAGEQGISERALVEEVALSYAPGIAPDMALRAYALNYYRNRATA